jgi:hypothetical protein
LDHRSPRDERAPVICTRIQQRLERVALNSTVPLVAMLSGRRY